MPAWDRQDLIERCRTATRRPKNDREVSDAQWAAWLTEAQQHWHRNICAHVPHVHWSEPTSMVSPDGGRTWRVPGVDEFVGGIQLRHGRPWGGIVPPEEYHVDPAAGLIRAPHESVFGWAPFIRYAAPLEPIRTGDTPTEPTLRPPSARILMVYHAAELFARSGGLRDPAPYVALQQKEWIGDISLPGALGILDTLKLQYMSQEAELAEASGGVWYRSPDLR